MLRHFVLQHICSLFQGHLSPQNFKFCSSKKPLSTHIKCIPLSQLSSNWRIGYFYRDWLCPAQAFISATYYVIKMSTEHFTKGSESLLALGLFCPFFSAIWEMCKGFCCCSSSEFQLKYQLSCLLFSRSALFTLTMIHSMITCVHLPPGPRFHHSHRTKHPLPVTQAFTWSSSFCCHNLGWVKETRWEK